MASESYFNDRSKTGKHMTTIFTKYGQNGQYLLNLAKLCGFIETKVSYFGSIQIFIFIHFSVSKHLQSLIISFRLLNKK